MAENIIDLSNQSIDQVPDATLLDKGEEVELRITGMTSGTDKNDLPYLMFFYDVPDEPTVAEISEFVGLPNTGREERDNIKARRKLKAIGECFGIDWSNPVSIDDIKGLRGFVVIKGVNKDGTANEIGQYMTQKS